MKVLLIIAASLISSVSFATSFKINNQNEKNRERMIIRGEKSWFPALKSIKYLGFDREGNPASDQPVYEYNEEGYLLRSKTQGYRRTIEGEDSQKSPYFNVFENWEYKKNGLPKHSFNIWAEKEILAKDGQEFLAYQYDNNDQLIRIEKNAKAYVEITYDDAGRVRQVNKGLNKTVFDYDNNTVTTVTAMRSGGERIDSTVTYEKLENLVRARDVSSITYGACSYNDGPILSSSCYGKSDYSCTLDDKGDQLVCDGRFVSESETYHTQQVFINILLGESFTWILSHEDRKYENSNQEKARYTLDTDIDSNGFIVSQKRREAKKDDSLSENTTTAFEWDVDRNRLLKVTIVREIPYPQDEFDKYREEITYNYRS
ncbi:MAG: hypothetical protein H6618_05320 [Deltaproteobacteria bacterium]|nr:hypothetical protein [Deltaproteobacteria bacterium]